VAAVVFCFFGFSGDACRPLGMLAWRVGLRLCWAGSPLLYLLRRWRWSGGATDVHNAFGFIEGCRLRTSRRAERVPPAADGNSVEAAAAGGTGPSPPRSCRPLNRTGTPWIQNSNAAGAGSKWNGCSQGRGKLRAEPGWRAPMHSVAARQMVRLGLTALFYSCFSRCGVHSGAVVADQRGAGA